MSEGRNLINDALERTGNIMSMTHDDRYDSLISQYLAVERWPASSVEAMAKCVHGSLQSTMREGEVFAVDADIAELLAGAGSTCPTWELQPSDLPAPQGFIHIPSGITFEDSKGKDICVTGIWWQQCEVTDDLTDDELAMRNRRLFGKHGTVAIAYDGDVQDYGPTADEDATGILVGVLSDLFHERDTAHSTTNGHLEEIRGAATTDRFFEDTSRNSFTGVWGWNFGEEHVQSQWVPFFAAFLRFIVEPYVEQRAILADRPSRRRAQRMDVKTDPVHVVRLRKVKHESSATSGDEHGTIEYSHRFMVTGHWRNQWYPSIQSHRPRWIAPYIKGPDDKPLVVRDTAFLVDR